MPYSVKPDEQQLLQHTERRHRGDPHFMAQVREGLDALKRDPRQFMRRIKKLPDGRYRYRHGRCRIVYSINEDERSVRISQIALRDEATYRDL